MSTPPIVKETLSPSMQVMNDPKAMTRIISFYLNGKEVAVLSGLNRTCNKMLSSEEICKKLLQINYPRSPLDPRLLFKRQLQELSQVYTNQTKGIHFEHSLKGHEDFVLCVQISPCGTRAISGSQDQNLMLWDLEEETCMRVFKGHGGPIRCLEMSSDGRRVISGSTDSTLKLWNVDTGACIRTFNEPNGSILCLQMSSDGTKVIAASQDGNIRLWNLETGECLDTFPGVDAVNCLKMSPDEGRIVSGSSRGEIKLWTMESREVGILQQPQDNTYISILQMSSDGKMAISGSSRGEVKVWDLENGVCKWTLDGASLENISGLQLSLDKKRALSGAPDGKLWLWNLETGESIHCLNNTVAVCCLQMSSDGKRAISAGKDGSLRLWDLEAGKCLQTYYRHARSISCLQMSPDGRKIISGSKDCSLRVFDFSLPTELFLLDTAHFFTRRFSAKIFTKLPQGIQNGVYRELYRVLGSPTNVQFNYGELAFQSSNVTDTQKAEAIYSYFRATFLRNIQTSLEQANTPVTFQAALKRVNNLPKEMHAVVWPIFVSRLTEYFSQVDSPEKLRAALEIFSLLSPATKGAIYEELYRILGSPEGFPFNYAELAFHEKDGYTANNQQRTQALFNHFSPVFLKIILAEFQKEPSQQALQNALSRSRQLPVEMQGAVLRVILPKMAQYFEKANSPEALEALLQTFSLLPENVRNAIYGELYGIQGSPQNVPFNYGQLAFQGQNFTATNQQRAEAIRNYLEHSPLTEQTENKSNV